MQSNCGWTQLSDVAARPKAAEVVHAGGSLHKHAAAQEAASRLRAAHGHT
jgi:hypothetical protein